MALRKSGELFRVYAELPHARQQRRPINADAHGSAVSPTHAPPGLLQNTYDLLPLLLIIFVAGTFYGPVVQRPERFFDDLGYVLTVRAIGAHRRRYSGFVQFCHRYLPRPAAVPDNR